MREEERISGMSVKGDKEIVVFNLKLIYIIFLGKGNNFVIYLLVWDWV